MNWISTLLIGDLAVRRLDGLRYTSSHAGRKHDNPQDNFGHAISFRREGKAVSTAKVFDQFHFVGKGIWNANWIGKFGTHTVSPKPQQRALGSCNLMAGLTRCCNRTNESFQSFSAVIHGKFAALATAVREGEA